MCEAIYLYPLTQKARDSRLGRASARTSAVGDAAILGQSAWLHSVPSIAAVGSTGRLRHSLTFVQSAANVSFELKASETAAQWNRHLRGRPDLRLWWAVVISECHRTAVDIELTDRRVAKLPGQDLLG